MAESPRKFLATVLAFLALGLTALVAAATPAKADISQTVHDTICPEEKHCAVAVHVGTEIWFCGGPSGFTVWVESDEQGIKVYHPEGTSSGHWDGYCW